MATLVLPIFAVLAAGQGGALANSCFEQPFEAIPAELLSTGECQYYTDVSYDGFGVIDTGCARLMMGPS